MESLWGLQLSVRSWNQRRIEFVGDRVGAVEWSDAVREDVGEAMGSAVVGDVDGAIVGSDVVGNEVRGRSGLIESYTWYGR